jgi:hypothetical protein
MATGIQISPPSDITVGTTAISNGTEGRVLFQGAGNVVQQSNNLFWDNTNSRLGIGTISPATGTSLDVNGRIKANIISVDAVNNTINTVTLMQFTGTGNRLHDNSGTHVVNIRSGNFGIGIGATTPGARLDVRAQGALSTDIAFRVRNSADSANLIDVLGNGQIGLQQNASFGFYGIRINPDSSINARVGSSTAVWRIDNSPGTAFNEYGFANNNPALKIGTTFGVYQSTDNREYTAGFFGRGIVTIGQTPFAGTIKPNEANTNTMYVFNGTAPTLSANDSFNLYSADIVAGNAAPHFRTEAGDVVKLYKETTASLGTGATFTNGTGAVITEDATFGGLTLAQIAKALGNLGLVELTA